MLSGRGGNWIGTVVCGPAGAPACPSGVVVTLGFAGAAGVTGPDFVAGLDRSVTEEAVPDARDAMIASESDVTMNNPAATAVAFDRTVVDPRGPKAVWEPIPPNAPARSAALPLCSKTTTTRNTQTRMWTNVINMIM